LSCFLTAQPLLLPGEFCPQGTQEETRLSIATCQLDPTSAAGGSSSSSSALGSCKGFKACPAGSFCPNASTVQPCAAGSYCPAGSLKGEPCNITVGGWALNCSECFVLNTWSNCFSAAAPFGMDPV
jgi:hypothetical protein